MIYEPKTVFCPHCKRECPFFGHCTENLPSPNVFDLSGFKGRHPFANNGILTFEEIDKIVWREGLALSKLQRAQLDAYLDKEEDGLIIDHKAIKEFVDKLSFPLYHLDFETVLIAIPRFEGARPNESMPTQYSLHIEDGYGGLEHKEFLGDSEDTRRAIAESLCENIPADACVLAYNKAFECSRLKELAEVFPDLSDHLLAIRGNIIDLMAPFENGDYYDIAMKGSYSIKSVLPALYPNDPELDYGALDLVHHGGEAMEAYPKMLKAAPEEKEALRKALLAYCKLDTLAMVKVLQKLKDVIWFDRDSNIWNERKWAKQRSERGFSDNDVFDIPRWFGSIMPKMLEEFLKSNKRIPLRFYEEYYDLHEKELSQYGKRDFINLYYAPGNPRYDPLRQAEKDKMEAWAAAKWDETIQEMIRLFREGENGWGCPWKELEDRAPHIAKWQKKALAMLAEYINELWW